MRKELIYGKIKTSGLTFGEVAKRLGITQKTLDTRLKSGKLLVRDAEKISKMIGLTKTEILEYFFNQELY